MSPRDLDRIMDKLDKIEGDTSAIKVNVACVMQKQAFHDDALRILRDTAQDNQKRIMVLEKGSRRAGDPGHNGTSIGTKSFRLWNIPREFILPVLAIIVILATLACVLWEQVEIAKMHVGVRESVATK